MTAPETFTVYAYDLNTNTPLAEIPASNLRFTSRLNDAGVCSFDIQLADPRVQRISPATATAPWQVALYIDRNGVLVWGGIVVGRNYNATTRVLSVSGKEFLGWTDQRILVKDYDSQALINLGYSQTVGGVTVGAIDPAVLLELVFTDAQAAGVGASIGITVPTTTSALPKLAASYKRSQFIPLAQVVNDVCAMLSPGVGGVDVAIAVAWGAGNTAPTRTLVVSSPRAGRIQGSSGLVFDVADAISWSWPEDGTQFGTRFTVTGSGSGTLALVGSASAPVGVGGLGQPPWLDLVTNHPGINSVDQLTRLAASDAITFGQPLATPQLVYRTVSASGSSLGTWIMGDDARIVIPIGDERFPSGLDQSWRIVGHTVTVPDEGVSTVGLTFNMPPIY